MAPTENKELLSWVLFLDAPNGFLFVSFVLLSFAKSCRTFEMPGVPLASLHPFLSLCLPVPERSLAETPLGSHSWALSDRAVFVQTAKLTGDFTARCK